MRRLRYGGVIQQAIKAVPITEILRSMGVDAPGLPPFGSSVKIYCPNGIYHPDGGAEKEVRLYPDGKMYCHICVEQHDSVSLAAQAWGCRPLVAARQLLEGREVAEASVVVADRSYELRAGAVAALGVWADARGVDRFSEAYRRCTVAADGICEPEDVDRWLAACKVALTRV